MSIMQEKTAYLISCSDHFSHRLNVAHDHLRARGYRVQYITSDFDHVKKVRFTCDVPDCVQIPAKAYRKNLSVSRILSHYCFARDVFRYLESLSQEPDVVLALIPPNFLAHYAAKYKKAHPNVRLIFDIFDMWPETFPSGKAKKLLAPVFGVWSRIRDRNLGVADFVITECELFRRKLRLSRKKSEAVYLCGDSMGVVPQIRREDAVLLCYLGSVNNVVDIPQICGFIEALAQMKPVELHIIGSGERVQELIDGAEHVGAKVEYYGAIFDPEQKLQIMSQCHFGLNVMKVSTCIGLTMKSLDYLCCGLPIINNVPADTQLLVQVEKIGLDLNEECAYKVAAMTPQEHLAMQENVKCVFAERFDRSVIDRQYEEILDKVL